MQITQGIPVFDVSEEIQVQGIPVSDPIKINFEHGAEVTFPEPLNQFLKAVIMGNVACVRTCINHKADIHFTTQSGNTAVHYATFMQHNDILKILIEAGANINQQNNAGQTPVMVAASRSIVFK